MQSPRTATAALIAATTLLRLAFGVLLGLGVDESYMVAAGRHLELSYFDHPPLAWWLTWISSHLFGSEGHLAVRLPFILLFAATSWLMYRLGAKLYSPWAGFWSAVLLNIMPVFGVTTATWVLPDGPLDCALLLATLCLLEALESGRWVHWMAAGAALGLAMLSKYTAVLSALGVVVFLATQKDNRRWLAQPAPYLAAALACALFAPVVIWNAQHGWGSFLFQGDRAEGARLHVAAPFVGLAGEAVFLLPWLWLPLMAAAIQALRRGPGDAGSWLLCCVGLTPVAVFTAVSLVSSHPIMFHWAAPGYLLLIPLLGRVLSVRIKRRDRIATRVVAASAIFVFAGVVVGTSEIRWNWLPELGEHFAMGQDPDVNGLDWTSLRSELEFRARLLGLHDVVIAGLNWHDTGKLSYALGPSSDVVCLCSDAREFGALGLSRLPPGRDALIVVPGKSPAQTAELFGPAFASVVRLAPLYLMHDGERAMRVPLYLKRAAPAERP